MRMQPQARTVPATFGRRPIAPDPAHEKQLASQWRESFSVEERLGIYDRFRFGQTKFDSQMRRIALGALVAKMGDDVAVGAGVGFLHADRFEIGDGVFLGAGAFLQGRHDGHCVFGKRVWIGPGAYLDARDLELGDFVGWGPGAKVLGSEHTAEPDSLPIIQTDLVIAPVRVHQHADIGTNAVILPGITVGEGAIVGAGAVVTEDVAAFAVVAGVPARELRRRRK
jgi:acetyltransferase-like isoleucine patch superfamily enzyme